MKLTHDITGRAMHRQDFTERQADAPVSQNETVDVAKPRKPRAGKRRELMMSPYIRCKDDAGYRETLKASGSWQYSAHVHDLSVLRRKGTISKAAVVAALEAAIAAERGEFASHNHNKRRKMRRLSFKSKNRNLNKRR